MLLVHHVTITGNGNPDLSPAELDDLYSDGAATNAGVNDCLGHLFLLGPSLNVDMIMGPSGTRP
jgi:hypothetical protein